MKTTRRQLLSAFTVGPFLPRLDVAQPDDDKVVDVDDETDFTSPQACEDHYAHAGVWCRALTRFQLEIVQNKHPQTWKRLQYTGVCLFQCGAGIVCFGGVPSYCRAQREWMKDLFGDRVVSSYCTPKGPVCVMMVKGESEDSIRAEIEQARRAERTGAW